MERELELAKALKTGTLDLICPEMELLACPNYREIALKGVGAIKSDSLGRLYFRMVAPFRGPLPDVLDSSRQPGEVASIRDCVMLRAIDESGREWRSSPLVIDLRNCVALNNWCFERRLPDIMHSEVQRGPTKSSIQILVPNSLRLPFDTATRRHTSVREKEIAWSSSIDTHIHKIGDAEVSFRSETDKWLSVFASQKSAFTPSWSGMLCHALGFATAQTPRPAVTVRSTNDFELLGLFSDPSWNIAQVIPPPVHCATPGGAANFWRLVELFFVYVESNRASSLVEELDGIRRGSRGSFQTACLTLAVGIEPIAQLLLRDEPKRISSDAISDLTSYIENWSGDSTLKMRAKQLLGRMSEASAADRMYAWADRTGTPHQLIDNWKKLRHPRAHGNQVAQQQVGYDLYYSAIELLHRIVCSEIGYDGPIVPTSQRGWTDSTIAGGTE